MADKEGRLEDRPARIKAEVLPYDDCDIDKLLQALCKDLQGGDEFIIRYFIDGKSYIVIPKFAEHQYPHHREKESIIPPYQGEAKPGRARGKPRARLNMGTVEPQLSPDPAHLNPESPILNPYISSETEFRLETEPKKFMPDYEGLYANYPRKEGKADGLKKCRKEFATPELYAKLKKAVSNYALAHRDGHPYAQHLYHFSTFVNGKWLDWIEPPTVNGAHSDDTTTRKILEMNQAVIDAEAQRIANAR